MVKYYDPELDNEFWHDLEVNIGEQERLKHWRDNNEMKKVIQGALYLEQSETDHEIYDLADWIFGPDWTDNKEILSEVREGEDSKDPRVRKFFLNRKYRYFFFDRLIDELKRYELKMVDKELDEADPTAPMGSENDPVHANEEKSNEDAQEEE